MPPVSGGQWIILLDRLLHLTMFKHNFKRSNRLYLLIEILLYCLITVSLIGLFLI